MNLSDEVILDVVQGVIDDILKPKFISLGMNASGQWLASLEARVNNGSGEIWGMDYTYWLQKGRGKNDDQSEEAINHFTKWAGYYIFKPWVEAKGLSINPYFVARKIAKEGTSSHPQGTDLLEVLNSDAVGEYIKDRIGRFLIQSIQVDILKRTKETLITA